MDDKSDFESIIKILAIKRFKIFIFIIFIILDENKLKKSE